VGNRLVVIREQLSLVSILEASTLELEREIDLQTRGQEVDQATLVRHHDPDLVGIQAGESRDSFILELNVTDGTCPTLAPGEVQAFGRQYVYGRSGAVSFHLRRVREAPVLPWEEITRRAGRRLSPVDLQPSEDPQPRLRRHALVSAPGAPGVLCQYEGHVLALLSDNLQEVLWKADGFLLAVHLDRPEVLVADPPEDSRHGTQVLPVRLLDLETGNQRLACTLHFPSRLSFDFERRTVARQVVQLAGQGDEDLLTIRSRERSRSFICVRLPRP
jgi:hypothetical protein